MKLYTLLFLATSLVFLIIDGIWLGVVAWPFYKSEIGQLLKPISIAPAIIFYVIYVVAMIYFVISPNLNPYDWKNVLMMGFMLGVVCYATYDLTNLATLKDWSWKVSLIDIIWGGFVTSTTTSIVAYLFRGMS